MQSFRKKQLIIVSFLFWTPVVLFSYLAGEVLERQPILFDTNILNWINAHASPFLEKLFLVITTVGNAEIITPLTLLIVGLLIYRNHRRKAALVLAGFFGAAAANILLKFLFHRERPTFWPSILHETSYSFPSGHAMASSALIFACIAISWNTRLRYVVTGLGLAFMVLIGYSRLYFGVHYPTDIIAAWSASLAWISIVTFALHGKLNVRNHIKIKKRNM